MTAERGRGRRCRCSDRVDRVVASRRRGVGRGRVDDPAADLDPAARGDRRAAGGHASQRRHPRCPPAHPGQPRRRGRSRPARLDADLGATSCYQCCPCAWSWPTTPSPTAAAHASWTTSRSALPITSASRTAPSRLSPPVAHATSSARTRDGVRPRPPSERGRLDDARAWACSPRFRHQPAYCERRRRARTSHDGASWAVGRDGGRACSGGDGTGPAMSPTCGTR